MKNLLALASLIVAANAAHAGLYVKGSMLFASVDDVTGSGSYGAKVDSSTGYTVGLGYRFSILAIEAEALSLKNDISGISGNGASDANGSVKQAHFFANAILNVPGIPLVTPFAGVGVGFGKADLSGNVQFSNAADSHFSSSDTVWGWQAFVGARVAIPATSLSVFADWRYTNMDSVVVKNISGDSLDSGNTTSSFEIGASWGF